MTCPNCFEKTKVIDSRHEDDFIRRRRVCTNCNYRFFTVELDEDYYERLAKERSRHERQRKTENASGNV